MWFVFTSALFFYASPSTANLPPIRVAMLSFEDQAGFQGKWQLSRDVPRLLGMHLDNVPGILVVSSDSLSNVQSGDQNASQSGRLWRSIAERLGADVLIRGNVRKFGVRRTVAGDPNTLGYKSYTHSVWLDEIELIDGKSGSVLSTLNVKKDSVERPMEFNLFGKPSSQDREFRALLSAQFASDKFYGLTFGRHVRVVFEDLSGDIADSLLTRDSFILPEDAKVLAVDGEQIYLNVGVGDMIRRGDIFPIIQGGKRVGVIRVEEIIGQHLSKAVIMERKSPIKTGLSLGKRLLPGKLKN